MTEPKRRGRPPKVRAIDDVAQAPLRSEPLVVSRPMTLKSYATAMGIPQPTRRLRHKPGVGIQQAWTHHNGTEWRVLPVVPASAPDWEDA